MRASGSHSGAEVTYISDDEIAALPDHPEQRFIALERIVRQRYEEAFNRLADYESALPLLRSYMSIVLPAAQHCGIEALSSWDRPPRNADRELYDAFIADVDYCITTLRLRNIEHNSARSVALNAAMKSKLRQMLNHIRQAIDKSVRRVRWQLAKRRAPLVRDASGLRQRRLRQTG
jgi:hypothetical protein